MDIDIMAAISTIIKNAVVTFIVLAEKVRKKLGEKKTADSDKSTDTDDSDN